MHTKRSLREPGLPPADELEWPEVDLAVDDSGKVIGTYDQNHPHAAAPADCAAINQTDISLATVEHGTVTPIPFPRRVIDPAEVEDWVMDVAVSASRDAQRSEVVEHVRQLIRENPTSADYVLLLGFAYYHLWKAVPPELAAEALEALGTALRLSPDREFARLYRIYIQFDQGLLAGALADCRLLDRSYFDDPDIRWRALSADEIEFACLVDLAIDREQLPALLQRIVAQATEGADDIFPFRPGIFLRAVERAQAAGLLADVDRSLIVALEELVATAEW